MKLCLDELRKQLTDKLMWGVLAFLLLLNMAFCYYFTDNYTGFDILPAMKTADEAYQNDPEGVLETYHLYREESEAYEAALKAWIDSKTEQPEPGVIVEQPVDPNIPSTYCEGWKDYELFDVYFQHQLSDDEYRELISSAINTSICTLQSYQAAGNDSDSFAYRYQLHYIDVYTKTLDRVKITEGFAYGWDILFAYSGTGLFILLAALFIGSRLFAAERDCGMHLLLRTTRHGRDRQAVVKLISALILAILLTLLFTSSSMAVIGWKVGFSSPLGSVQQISDMLYCQFPLSMLTCLLLTMLWTALAAYVICLLTTACSLILHHSLGAMMTTAVLVGLFYYLFNYGNPNFSKYVNIFTAVSAETLLGQWRAVHVVEHPVSQLIPLAILLFCILFLSAIIGWQVWSQWGMGVSSSKKGRLFTNFVRMTEKLPLLKRRSLSIAVYEQQKLLPSKLTGLCVLLIVLKILLSLSTVDGQLTYADEIKLQYMEQYEEMSLEESYEAVNARLAYYTEISSKTYINAMAIKRVTGEITREEYSAYRNELNDARTYQKSLASFAGELEYLLEKEAETGITAKPVFSTGFRKLLESDFNVILVIIFVVLFCGSYAREYEMGFMPLLRSTKRGRVPVFLAKGGLVLSISLLLSLSFTLLDMGLVFARYNMDCVDAPLFAISTYHNTASGLTVGNYLLLIGVLRLCTYTLFGLLIAALSGALRSEWSVAGVMLLCFIPYLLKGIGLDVFELFDITMLLSVDQLYLFSTAIGKTGGLWFLGLSIAALTALVGGLVIASYRKFCK